MANDIAIKILAARLTSVQADQAAYQGEAENYTQSAAAAQKNADQCGVTIAALQSAIKMLSQ